MCVGSAVYMLVSTTVAGNTWDPGRIAAQVASGIGFLGAGTILKQGSMVRGLTTAASLWVVAGIGLAAGLGGTGAGIALLGTLIVFLSLHTLKILERRLDRVHRCDLRVTISRPRERMDWANQILATHGIKVRGLSIQENGDGTGKITIAGRDHAREPGAGGEGDRPAQSGHRRGLGVPVGALIPECGARSPPLSWGQAS